MCRLCSETVAICIFFFYNTIDNREVNVDAILYDERNGDGYYYG